MSDWLLLISSLLVIVPVGGLGFVLSYRALQARWIEQQRRHYERYRSQLRKLQDAIAQAKSPEDLMTIAQSLQATTRDEVEALKHVIIEAYGEEASDTVRKSLALLYETLGLIADDIQTVRNGTLEEQSRATFRLGRLRHLPALDTLERASRHSSAELRLVAVWALTELADARGIKPVVLALSEANGWQLMQAANRLLDMRLDLTLPLMELLDSAGGVRERRERIMATVLDLITDFGSHARSYINPVTGRQAAIRLLESDSVNLRTRAIRALTALGVESSQEIGSILRALGDKNWEVRAVAARAIGDLQLTAGLSALQDAVSDKAWWVRHNAAQSLKKLGDAGESILLQLLQSEDRFARETVTQVLQSN
ncbi:HEAT repeat domain-containing protein [Chloracidobacterium validum]|uniref:HEAT repeat domain-containing protein n=1 Tax=Chloracidobacterium validum TaxID=2821543 RepID=A0ABX8B987_9BACT|nr:HEAT repeat domain-containing protein [Chloracidobacterium validum]QUW03503.1 HEAT repeat domain-containing protein [Chloracidobacterium validum]